MTFLTPEQVEAKRKLPVLDQARIMVKALPKATRVGEFIAMWRIAKGRDGATSVEAVAEMWNEPVRTMYRRLEEFREVWAPAGYETPDPLADYLIADYRRRKETLSLRHVTKLLTEKVPTPSGVLPWNVP